MSLRIWAIDFDGNSYFTDELLLETLRDAGYETGMEKSGIVCDSLELLLRETYPEITWVSAQIKGTRLIVQLREKYRHTRGRAGGGDALRSGCGKGRGDYGDYHPQRGRPR